MLARHGFVSVSLFAALVVAGCSPRPAPAVPSAEGVGVIAPGSNATALGWVGAWGAAPQLTEPGNMPPEPGLAGNTLRQKVLPTFAGSRVRLHFSNAWGEAPLRFESVRLARASDAAGIDAASDRGLRFGGSESVTIAAGETIVSDALEFELPALEPVAITIAFGAAPSHVTGHPGSRTTSYLASGNVANAAALPVVATTDHWYFITGIDVEAPAGSRALVTLGDSITDGRGSTTNGNDRWPDQLARRLRLNPGTSHVSVLNQGIGGNAVVAGGLGPTALERFERDVLEQRGVRWVIVLEGVNDIGGSSDAAIAERLIAAYQTMIERAHARDVRVYGAPILPFGGSFYDSPAHEAARQAVNHWIRTSGQFDAVIPLDVAVADPENPARLLPAYDTGDMLHLSPAGYKAMAGAIDLELFSD